MGEELCLSMVMLAALPHSHFLLLLMLAVLREILGRGGRCGSRRSRQ